MPPPIGLTVPQLFHFYYIHPGGGTPRYLVSQQLHALVLSGKVANLVQNYIDQLLSNG